LIREKIIGGDVAVFASPRTGYGPLVHASGGRRAFAPLVRRELFAFLHQQARQHGRRILLKPGTSNCMISLRRFAAWLNRESS
jgi:hypothetical protein